jgi:hypothetical protein
LEKNGNVQTLRGRGSTKLSDGVGLLALGDKTGELPSNELRRPYSIGPMVARVLRSNRSTCAESHPKTGRRTAARENMSVGLGQYKWIPKTKEAGFLLYKKIRSSQGLESLFSILNSVSVKEILYLQRQNKSAHTFAFSASKLIFKSLSDSNMIFMTSSDVVPLV